MSASAKASQRVPTMQNDANKHPKQQPPKVIKLRKRLIRDRTTIETIQVDRVTGIAGS